MIKTLALISILLSITVCVLSMICACMYAAVNTEIMTIGLIGAFVCFGFTIATLALINDELDCFGCGCCSGPTVYDDWNTLFNH